jgi:hypothetical protein
MLIPKDRLKPELQQEFSGVIALVGVAIEPVRVFHLSAKGRC